MHIQLKKYTCNVYVIVKAMLAALRDKIDASVV